MNDEKMHTTWHRDVVGGMWEQIGRLQYDFLRQQGLQPSQYLLDVGCGSFRGGIHFIEYLEDKHYFGIDQNETLINAGIECELKPRNLEETPVVKVMDNFDFCSLHQTFDFALAQSVFTHLPWNNILRCLINIRKVLTPAGKFFATFFENTHPACSAAYLEPVTHARGNITTYPDRDPFHYEFDVFRDLAARSGLQVEYLGDWNHPKDQMMMMFTQRRH